MASSQIFGSVRQGSRRAYTSGGIQTLDLNLGGDALVSQGLPERTELVRLGYSFSAQMPAASAWTLLITIPTTLANLALQNANGAAASLLRHRPLLDQERHLDGLGGRHHAAQPAGEAGHGAGRQRRHRPADEPVRRQRRRTRPRSSWPRRRPAA
jgi:hypothetical protein